MRWLIVLATTVVGAVWLYHKGPLPIILHSTALPKPAPFWYSLTPFPIFGMLLADLVALFRIYGIGRRTVELGIQIGIIVVISHLRLALTIPISGHTLLFAYFILRRLVIKIPKHRASAIETLIAIIFYLITVVFKFTQWYAPYTLATGTLIAVGLIIVSFCIVKR